MLVALPLSVWQIYQGSCLVLGTDADALILLSKGIFVSCNSAQQTPSHTLSSCWHCLCSVWVQQDHFPGLQSSGAVRRAASSTLPALTIALATAPWGSCFCGEAPLTVLLHCLTSLGHQQSTEGLLRLPRAAAPVAPLTKVALDKDLHCV